MKPRKGRKKVRSMTNKLINVAKVFTVVVVIAVIVLLASTMIKIDAGIDVMQVSNAAKVANISMYSDLLSHAKSALAIFH